MIGIVIPTKKEAKHFITSLGEPVREDLFGFSMYRGKFGDKSVSLVVSGVGKVNCAAATSFLISRIDPNLMVLFGGAGDLRETHEVQSIGVCTKVIEHDYINSFFDKRTYPQVRVEGEQISSFIDFCLEKRIKIEQFTVASGDEDICSEDRRRELKNLHVADIADWETYSFCKVCSLAKIPMLPIRVVSDFANKDAKNDFFENILKISALGAEIVGEYIRKV